MNVPAAQANIQADASGVSPTKMPRIVPKKLKIDDKTL